MSLHMHETKVKPVHSRLSAWNRPLSCLLGTVMHSFLFRLVAVGRIVNKRGEENDPWNDNILLLLLLFLFRLHPMYCLQKNVLSYFPP